MIDDHRSYRLGLLMVTMGTVAWSFAGFFTRLITLDSWTMLFWRGVVGAITALVMLLVQRRGRIVPAFRDLDGAGLLFTLCSGLGMTAFLTALKYTTVAHVSIIYGSVPFVAAAAGWLVLRERSSPATLGACAVAFGGVAITVAAGAGEGHPLGDALALIMTLLMAACFVIARRSRGIPMVPSACLAALFAAGTALPFAHVWPIAADQLAALVVFGVTNMGLGLILVTAGSKLVPAVESALIGSLEAPLAPLWVWLAFGETPLLTTVIGGALVMAAVLAHVLIAARRPMMTAA